MWGYPVKILLLLKHKWLSCSVIGWYFFYLDMEPVFTFLTEAASPKASIQQFSSHQHHQRWEGQGYEGRAPSDKDWKRQDHEDPAPNTRIWERQGEDPAPRNKDWERQGAKTQPPETRRAKRLNWIVQGVIRTMLWE